MTTHPCWSNDKNLGSAFPPLAQDVETDVAIVGGGITGITTAYELAKAGKRVTLLEQNELLSGDTGRTTAFFTYIVDASLMDLKNTFGEASAKRVWASNREIIDEVERIVRAERIDCDFRRCPVTVYAHDQAGQARLMDVAALGQSMGFPVAFKTDALPFPSHGFLFAPDQAKLQPIAYLRTLASRAAAAGADIRERTHVHAIEGHGPVTLFTSGGKITAKDVVIATHGPVTHTLQFPARLQASRTYAAEARIPSGMLPEGLYWNTEQPYHYFRVDRGDTHDRLIMGGEDHVTGNSASENACFETLKSYFRRLLPHLEMTFSAQWSGQIYQTIDGLPYIGRPAMEKHIYVATGYDGNGMTFGTIAAKIIADTIVTGAHPWSDLYAPLRPHGIGPLMEHGISFVRELIQGRLRADADSTEEIPKGSGKIVVENGKPIAVYKDDAGTLLKCSGVCTHMRCTVRWNDAEKSWDCPCHGSRFGTDGSVLNGPATAPLDRA